MYKLKNSLHHYAWGSLTAFTEYFGLANPKHLPIAELWMGAHPSASSKIFIRSDWRSLAAEITANPIPMLGKATLERFQQLPFLVKFLAADQPLSVQVHPNLIAAQQGFLRENRAGIPLDHPRRNYRDANHKPEVLYALTPFKALNGFKPFTEIVEAFRILKSPLPAASAFIDNPNTTTLRRLFITCLRLKDKDKQQELCRLVSVAKRFTGNPWQRVLAIKKDWPDDCGLFMPLFLNIIDLLPGQAMYLAAGTPHTYLRGVGIEIMANSDNVLRAGLTAKHIDINELVNNITFHINSIDSLIIKPSTIGNINDYIVPVADFTLSIITISSSYRVATEGFPLLIACLEGSLCLSAVEKKLTLVLGESVFIPANQETFIINGEGKIALVTVGAIA